MFKALLNISSASLVVISLCAAPLAPLAASAHAAATETADMGEAMATLEQGRQLLRRHQADQAFNQLQTALKLFTAAGDSLKIAATEDALGDVYTQSGQYKVALARYQSALKRFGEARDVANYNAILTKIGEMHFLLGDAVQARAAFDQMTVAPPDESLKTAGAAGAQPSASNASFNPSTDDSTRGAASGGTANNRAATGGAAALASFATCFAPKMSGNIANNDPNNPPSQGRAPSTPNGVGRMDLRITDDAGNPVKGVRAQIQSNRPGGLYCEAFGGTSAIGRALMPPLHIADKIKLVLKAPGMPAQQLALSAQDIAQPVRVVLTKAGAQIANAAPQALSIVANPCFDFYRALIAYSTSELGIARADYNNNRLPEAGARYEKLLASLLLPDMGNRSYVPRFRTAARTALGDIALKEGRYADALKLYTEARDGARTDNRLDLMWAAQRGIGRTLWQQAQNAPNDADRARLRSEAMTAYREALKTIETIRAGSLRADDARTTFLASTKDVYDEAATLQTEMALFANLKPTTSPAATTIAPLEGYARTLAAVAFATTEQGRARSLLDMLGEARAGITEGVPAEYVKRRNEIAARQQQIVQMLTGVALPTDTPRQSIPELEGELDRLSVEYDGLENTIRTSSPRYAAFTGAQPLTLDEVQQRVLDANTVLLAYNLGAEQSYLWIITPTGVAVTRLPGRESIESQAMNLRTHLIPPKLRRSIVGIDVSEADATRETDASASAGKVAGADEFARAAHELYQTILQPAAALIGSKRLLVVADGALNYVPFESLVTAAPASDAGYASLAYLVKNNEVVYAPSASVIAAVRQQAEQSRKAVQPGASDSMLIVADPIFSASDVRVQKASLPAASEGAAVVRGLTLESAVADVAGATTAGMTLKRLGGTRTEAQEIAQLARAAQTTADVWLDFDASETNVTTRSMQGYRVLHFATHGLLDAERPKFTGLVLSLVGEQKGDDGFVRAGEVFNFRLGAPLVMLSACETGLGRERRGEGVIGLTRAFMYAGAPTVGVSLWSVSDRSTARLMSDFYKGFLTTKGASPASAMRDAQLQMIANPRYSAPFYWAPFVMVGDWR